MNIAIVGGRYKNMEQLFRIAEQEGHRLDAHEGHLHGSGVHEIRRVVTRADLLVILTSINSHGAMHVAKDLAKQLGTPTLIIRNMGAARFRTLLEAVDRRSQLGWPWPEATLETSVSTEPKSQQLERLPAKRTSVHVTRDAQLMFA